MVSSKKNERGDEGKLLSQPTQITHHARNVSVYRIP